VQGIIYIASDAEEQLNDTFLRIFSLIVSQISSAVENAHLFQQVEQERARLAAILASSTDAVLAVNRNGRIVLDNPAAREIIGAQESQRGRRLSESTSLQGLVDLFESAMQGSKPTGEILLDDGRTFFANLSPVSVGEAETIGWVATMQDVSHFKAVNQLKNEFVSTVSHDLRSPLSNILLAANMIAETGDINQQQQELLNLVENRAKGMGALIEDLLDMSQIEAGIEMDLKPCNLALIIADVVTAFTPQAAEKPIDLMQEVAAGLPPIMANATRLQQVVHNLVGNAIKYTPEGGRVLVKAYPQGNEMRVQVTDTGIGIPASDQPHVFEKFYRVKGEHALKIKGSGLGLAIVKSIVENMQGRIWLESVFGQGSTFTVALPLQRESPP
jgi:PAS domain S-box-containing protein